MEFCPCPSRPCSWLQPSRSEEGQAVKRIEELLYRKPDLHLPVPGVPLCACPLPIDILFPGKLWMLQTQALKLNVYHRVWKSTALFTLNLGRDTSPSWGLFDGSAEILRCCASVCTLLCRLEATAHLKQWFQLFLVAQICCGNFGFQLLRHSSGILLWFFPVKDGQIFLSCFKQKISR